MTPEEFRAELAKHGVKLSDEQMQQFQTYYEFLVATNEHVNLTAITKQDEVYLKHFYDSLLPALEVKDLQTCPFSICDVGAGAGFPSIPLKIAFPNLKVTIVDSLNKRIKFLEELSQKLNLTDTYFIMLGQKNLLVKRVVFVKVLMSLRRGRLRVCRS